ncbi:MAG: ADP-ribosylglycohydrolase family protein, partial [Lentisphaeria bacterium]|nr:ADP-ribosylglycohydrolase family protein [Lentisphaeria bacterium]
GWVAEEALAIAVFCALKHTWDFAAGVIEAVNITGDSDSTGAIAGNILGVLNGEKKIPQNWMKNLREYALVSSMADDLSCGIEKTPYGYATPEWEKKYPGY